MRGLSMRSPCLRTGSAASVDRDSQARRAWSRPATRALWVSFLKGLRHFGRQPPDGYEDRIRHLRTGRSSNPVSAPNSAAAVAANPNVWNLTTRPTGPHFLITLSVA